MKKYFLLTATLFTVFTLKAQDNYYYQKLGLGFDLNSVRGYTNLNTQYDHAAFDVSFIYNYSQYLPIAAEFQAGRLSGGGPSPDQDPYGRSYTNNYKALIFHADIMAGAIIEYTDSGFLNFLRNFYIGSGFGFVFNNNKVQRTNIIAANGPLNYVFPGKNTSVNLDVPLRFGYEFKIFNAFDEPKMAVIIGYVHSFVYGEGLDGYDDPSPHFKNNAPDQYHQIVIGYRYFFGGSAFYHSYRPTFY